MLSEISWGEYLFTALFITTLYYIGVLVLRFKIQIRAVLLNVPSSDNQKEGEQLEEESTPVDTLSNSEATQNIEETYGAVNDSEEVDQFIEAIQGAFRGKENLERNSVEQLLLKLFSTYSNIKQSTYRSSINEFIQSEGEKYGHVMPSEAEIDVLWDERA